MSASVGLLASEIARERLEGEVTALAAQVSPGVQIQWVKANDPSAKLASVQVAFVSRDVTGLSTKQMILPQTQAFYDALASASQLRWLNIHSAGMDRMIYQELAARGVNVTTSPGTNARNVAQTALAGLLALARRFPLLTRAQHAHEWAPLYGAQMPRDLAGQTALVIGWGEIAQRLAGYLAMLEFKVIVVRKKSHLSAGDFETIGLAQLDEVLPGVDWLILACPLTPETQGLIDETRLRRLPVSASLINIARGQIVDEAALISALTEKRLSGAFLDVFEHEPLSSQSPLWDLPNVILTPHSAGFSKGNEARVDALFLSRFRLCLEAFSISSS